MTLHFLNDAYDVELLLMFQHSDYRLSNTCIPHSLITGLYLLQVYSVSSKWLSRALLSFGIFHQTLCK